MMYYDFVRIHQTLRMTPAMTAGVSDKLGRSATLRGWSRTRRLRLRREELIGEKVSPPKTNPERDWIDYALAIGTLLAALFAGGAAVATAWQAYISQTTSARQLRAYVVVSNELKQNDGAISDLSFQNLGATPAYRLSTEYNFGKDRPSDAISAYAGKDRMEKVYAYNIGPNQKVDMPLKEFRLPLRQIFYLAGRTSYHDIFGSIHSTWFCFVLSKFEDGRVFIIACPSMVEEPN